MGFSSVFHLAVAVPLSAGSLAAYPSNRLPTVVYSEMQSDGNSFDRDVVSDSFIMMKTVF